MRHSWRWVVAGGLSVLGFVGCGSPPGAPTQASDPPAATGPSAGSPSGSSAGSSSPAPTPSPTPSVTPPVSPSASPTAGADVAVAVAFIVTELIELAVTCDSAAHVRVSVKETGASDRATLRVSSPALIDSPLLREGLATRFGRVTEGLARQLRAPLHHDPLTGAYEISIAVLGRD